jgi:hypothetical protein
MHHVHAREPGSRDKQELSRMAFKALEVECFHFERLYARARERRDLAGDGMDQTHPSVWREARHLSGRTHFNRDTHSLRCAGQAKKRSLR